MTLAQEAEEEKLKGMLKFYKITLDEYLCSCSVSDEEFYSRCGKG